MPYRRNYRKRPFRRGNRRWVKHAYGAAKFTSKALTGPLLSYAAKRFIKAYAPTVVTTAAVNKIIICEIPRNITGTDVQQENRVGRKVWVKGITVTLRLESANTTAAQTCRLVLARQSDPTEGLDLTTIYGPVGATTGIKILMDKFVRLDNAGTGTSGDGRQIKKYIKVNKPLLFNGDALDGSDVDEGCLVLYKATDDANGFTFRGATTVHYRELL